MRERRFFNSLYDSMLYAIILKRKREGEENPTIGEHSERVDKLFRKFFADAKGNKKELKSDDHIYFAEAVFKWCLKELN